MDCYVNRVPVRIIGSGTKYDDRIWYEHLSSIRSVNGKPVVDLKKSMLQEGDKVTVEYKNRTYQGDVEAPAPEPDQLQRSEEILPFAGKRSPRKRRPSERLLATTPEKKTKKYAKKPTPEKRTKRCAKKAGKLEPS